MVTFHLTQYKGRLESNAKNKIGVSLNIETNPRLYNLDEKVEGIRQVSDQANSNSCKSYEQITK